MPTTDGAGARLTYDDFLLFPDDGLRHEIIDGVHYVTPLPTVRHQDLVGRLHLAIGNFLADHPGLGRVFLPLDVVFTLYDIVEPDLLFIAKDRLGVLTEANVQGAPSLVVEVLSPSTRRRDEGIKRQLFARGGVREYWLVDPKRHLVKVFRCSDGNTFPRVAELSAEHHGVLTTPLLPGFSLALDELFAPSL